MRRLFALTLLFLTPFSAAAADATHRTTRAVALAPGTPIHLEATIADVTITGSNRPDIGIDVVRRAPTPADLDRFPVVIEERPDGLHVAALQENDAHDAALRSEITIAAPTTALFQRVRVFEGRVRLTNLKAACDVDLRRGGIEASGLAGRIRLESGIGSVDVKDSDLTSGGMMRLRVFNGMIRVRFARTPENARILALTFNGTIASDIPLDTKQKFGPRFGETTIGSGDPVLSMDVVKGDIAITVSHR